MPWSCFSYPSDMPPGTETRNAAQPILRDSRRMPITCYSYPVVSWCFSYDPGDVPRRMPYTCYSYSADEPGGVNALYVFQLLG
jgi:hypothetical protein